VTMSGSGPSTSQQSTRARLTTASPVTIEN